jgi:hypothetical protein
MPGSSSRRRCSTCASRTDARLGKIEEYFASDALAGRHLLLRRAQPRGRARSRYRSDRPRDASPRAIPSYVGRAAGDHDHARRSRARLPRRSVEQWRASPRMCANGSKCRRALGPPAPASCSSRPSRTRASITWCLQLRRLERAPVARHADHRRMEARRLKPLGFVASDYALAVYGLEPDHRSRRACSTRHPRNEFVDWVQQSHVAQARVSRSGDDRRAGRAPASRQAQDGRQVTFSTDLIYDVLRKYEPDHLLLRAAWADARARMTDVGRLARSARPRGRTRCCTSICRRVSPMAVPVLIMIGRERTPQGSGEEALLIEADRVCRRDSPEAIGRPAPSR